MVKQSKLKKVKQGKYVYIYIYFKNKGQIIRINTKNRFVPSCMTKELLYNSKMDDYEYLNNKTIELKKSVDKYIRYKLEGNIISHVSQKELTHILEKGTDFNYKNNRWLDLRYSKSKDVNDYLKEFYEFKKEELNNRPSYKDYLTLINSLTDYQKYFTTKLTFDKLNTIEFMVKYRNFLSLKREGKDYLTKGGLNDNTIYKRFSGLKTFFNWVENGDLFIFKRSIHNFKIPKYENDIVVLEKEDIRKLLDVEIINPTWKIIRDVFVCNCFMGLRYSDLITIKKSDFVLDEDGDYTLFQENKKTGFNVQISIQKTSVDILNKYNFELPKLSHQYFNRELKNFLEYHELFPEMIVKKRRVNKLNEDKEYPRRELITTHTCRRTFITLGINHNVPLNTLMLSSGHKKIQTLQSYMKKVQNKVSFKEIDI